MSFGSSRDPHHPPHHQGFRSAWRRRFASFFVLLAACGGSEPAPPLIPGSPAPALELPTLDGDLFDLRSVRGKKVLLNFWATWCQPCRRELPDLVAVAEDGEVEVIGIALDPEGAEVVRPFVEQNEIPYPVLIGNAEVFRRFQGFAIPYTVEIGPDQRIAAIHRGVFDPTLLVAYAGTPAPPRGAP